MDDRDLRHDEPADEQVRSPTMSSIASADRLDDAGVSYSLSLSLFLSFSLSLSLSLTHAHTHTNTHTSYAHVSCTHTHTHSVSRNATLPALMQYMLLFRLRQEPSYYYIRVLILLYVSSYNYMCPQTTIYLFSAVSAVPLKLNLYAAYLNLYAALLTTPLCCSAVSAAPALCLHSSRHSEPRETSWDYSDMLPCGDMLQFLPHAAACSREVVHAAEASPSVQTPTERERLQELAGGQGAGSGSETVHLQAQRTEQQQHSCGTRELDGVVAAGDTAAEGQRVSAASTHVLPVILRSAPQNSGPQSTSARQNSLSPLPGASPLLCSTSDWDCAGHADLRIEALRVCAPPAPNGLVGRNTR
jgi:hypothetical protein